MKNIIRKQFLILVSLTLLVIGVAVPHASAAVSDYVSVAKSVNPSSITTLEEAEVNLQVTGTPPVNVVVPNDVILIIDKSGSMLGDKMTNAKEAAKGFIDLLDLTKHQVGVVDYSETNKIGTFPLGTDKDGAKSYINTITANGSTATGDAIEVARTLLAGHRLEAQPVIVIMTDGDATIGSTKIPNAYDYAKETARVAKEDGIIFYTIALLNASDNPDTSGPNKLLKEMATTAAHHHFVLGSTGLADIYAAIVKEIGLASAFDVSVTDIVDPNFEIVPGSADNNIPKPTITGNTLTWKFNELKDSALTFKYKIRPVDKSKAGSFQTSTAASIIDYKDYAGAARTKAIPSATLKVTLPTPEITSLNESFGHPNGGESISINGKHFVSGATVQFGTISAKNVVVVNDTQITATVPAGIQGTVNVTVMNPDKQTAIAPYQYKTDPIITKIDPNNGPLAGGTKITVTGKYLMKGLTVKIGDNLATAVTLNSGLTYFSAIVPAALEAGTVDITVTNPDGTMVTIPQAYTYNEPPKTDPIITSINPNAGPITGGETVYVNGTNFKSGSKIYFGNIEATATYVSAARYSVIVPAGVAVGSVVVTIQDPIYSYTVPNAYTYNAIVYPAPTVTSVSPNTGLIAGGEVVYVNGTNFVKDITKVSIGGKEAVTTYVSAKRLQVTIPAGDAVGLVDVKVTLDTHEVILPQAYEYTLPTILPVAITSLSTNTGYMAGGEVIYVNGENFSSGAIVTIGTNVASSTFVSSARLKVTVPASTVLGKVDVTVTNKDGGTATLAQGYEYVIVAPTITSLSSTTGNKAGGESIYVNGTNFDSSATVTVNGHDAIVKYVSVTRLQVTIPANADIGPVPLVVQLSNGQAVSTTFTYDNGPALPAPTITASTTSGAVGYKFYLNGTNFTNKSTVYFGDTQATAVYVSAKRLTVTVPNVTGTVDIKVVNVDGQVSNTLAFTVQ